MRIAEILSDLASLRASNNNAALALVSARPNSTSESTSQKSFEAVGSVQGDPDLTRARDLLQLHANVKVTHQGGVDRDLLRAREDVDAALRMR